MKGETTIYYDEKADFLEMHVGAYTKGFFRDIGDGIAERIDEKTGEVTGVAIMSFKKKLKKKDHRMVLPVKMEISS